MPGHDREADPQHMRSRSRGLGHHEADTGPVVATPEGRAEARIGAAFVETDGVVPTQKNDHHLGMRAQHVLSQVSRPVVIGDVCESGITDRVLVEADTPADIEQIREPELKVLAEGIANDQKTERMAGGWRGKRGKARSVLRLPADRAARLTMRPTRERGVHRQSLKVYRQGCAPVSYVTPWPAYDRVRTFHRDGSGQSDKPPRRTQPEFSGPLSRVVLCPHVPDTHPRSSFPLSDKVSGRSTYRAPSLYDLPGEGKLQAGLLSGGVGRRTPREALCDGLPT